MRTRVLIGLVLLFTFFLGVGVTYGIQASWGPGQPVATVAEHTTLPTPAAPAADPLLDQPAAVKNLALASKVLPPRLLLRRPDKVAYLTFDDGPNPAKTDAILEILRQEKIKATFFVIGTQADLYPETLRHVVQAGQELANHTYDHDYRVIYASTDALLRSLKKNEDAVESHGGHLTKIIRAPGGSPQVPRAIKTALAAQGYHWYDWDISTADTANNPPATAEQMVTFVKQQLKNKGHEPELIVLMHDGATASPTLKALPGVIAALREAGYGFLPLSYIRKPGGEADWLPKVTVH